MRALALVLALILAALPAAAAGPSFRVRTFQVVGNTVLPDREVMDVLGAADRDLSLQDLHRLAGALTQRYRARGYFLAVALVPPQHVVDGRVTIAVNEGRVGRVVVEGNRRYAADYVRRWFAPVLAERVPTMETLRRCVRGLDALPDVDARVQLKPGLAPGETDLVVRLSESAPVRTTLEADNLGNRLTGQYHGGAAVEAFSVVMPGDQLTLRGLVPFPSARTTPLAQAAYVIPLDQRGTRVALSGGLGEFRAGQELASLDLAGSVTTWGVSLGRGAWALGLEGKSFANRIAGEEYSRDEIRAVRLSWALDWQDGDAASSAYVAWTQGLGPLLGGTRGGDPMASRQGASNAFGRLNADWRQARKAGDCVLVLRATGQWAAAPLLVAEQMPLGGVDTVRGYVQNYALVDSGCTVSAELRAPVSPSVQAACFVDHGTGWLRNPQPGQSAVQSLSGAGVGVRAQIAKDAVLRADLGFPLGSGPRRAVLYLQIQSGF